MPLSEEGLMKLEVRALLDQWNTTLNMADRDVIMKVLQKRKLFPEEYMRKWDRSIGAYPDHNDPEFLQRLLAKKEFAESFQSTWDPANDPCAADTKFEVTPVQRFVANLLSPRTPYMSALLYHGVGVGKTCSAIQISEAWLEEFPQEQVYIIAPPTIQGGFRSTIFGITERRLKIGTGTDPNKAFGCTGDTYLELTGTMLERDVKRIDLRVGRAINRRYKFFGYIQFANYVQSIVRRAELITDPVERDIAIRKAIRNEFSNKLLIIDEAHNLREVLGESTKKSEADPNADEPGGKSGMDDMKAGKLMTPDLLRVLDYSYGMKLLLMTATPMYNSHLEIIFLLNLLLRNDKKAPITQSDIFDKNGDLAEGADQLLGSYASRYVSFMRGENPRSFPIRLQPRLTSQNQLVLTDYPKMTMRDRPIGTDEKKYVNYLPIVKIPLPEESENYKASIAFLLEQRLNNTSKTEIGISSQDLGISVQAGNFVPPLIIGKDEAVKEQTANNYRERIRKGLAGVLDREITPRITYKAKAGSDAKWLLKENLINYSPKFVYLMDRLATCEGVAFVYSRFIDSGALPLAVALEANGYKCYKRETGFLEGGAQDGLGGQCALCNKREVGHSGVHPFKQAYYGLLTGEQSLTPKRDVIIEGEQAITNKNGAELKIVIGSQIASEGVDLRYVREVHVLDSWYHLNKTEQVIGRAIRFCSHSALDPLKRNTTVYLYAAYYPDMDNETADLYSYRLAFRKAKQVGKVSRVLKAYAIDCNLNHDAIIIRGQPPVKQIDSQRVERDDVNINDIKFTAICDWVDNCDYTCKPKIEKKDMGTDDSTYSEYAVRWREAELRERMRAIFSKTAFVELADIEAEFSDVPVIARTDFLTSIIDNKLFQVSHNGVKGYIKYCNNYLVFQPLVYADINIPLAIRMASFPVRKDVFDPETLELQDISLVEEEAIEASELGAVWNAFELWITSLSKSASWIEESKPISDRITLLARADQKMGQYYSMVISMIRQFHANVNKGIVDSEGFKGALLKFVWDNWFSLTEQKALQNPDMLRDGAYIEGGRTVYRFYNPDNDSLQYEENGAEATIAVRSAIQEKEKEELTEFRLNSRLDIGSPYGFLIGKKGLLVFKTNTVPTKGSTWDKGKECGNDTLQNPKFLILETLGQRLRGKGAPDLELQTPKIRGVLSAAQSCIIMELSLRYMDETRFDEKRWFYRPVNASILGHLGASLEKKPVKSKSKKTVPVIVIKTDVVAPIAETALPKPKRVFRTAPESTSDIKTVQASVPVIKTPSKNVVVTKEEE